MKILFVGQVIPNKIFDKYYDKCRHTADSAANVFYNALLKGISENGVDVTCRMSIPDSIPESEYNIWADKIRWKRNRYIPNLFLRIINYFFVSAYDVYKWSESSSYEDVVIFNVLRISQSVGGLIMCKLLGLKTLTIVTDVPGYRIQNANKSMIGKVADLIGQRIISSFDYYVFLSEAMTDVVPINGKPYAVIEGIYDEEENSICGQDEDYGDRFVVLYAGSLHYKYGVMNLVHAVQELQDSSTELHVYGEGEAAQEIMNLTKEYPNIQYKGSVAHDEILRLEREASLLVNPRPVDDEYVKYSFPSKNMEYMASGTPVLLTDIPSLPREYREYVTIIPNNHVKTIAEKVAEIKSIDKKDSIYISKATMAREFIIHNKNKQLQAKKLLELIRNVFP